MQDILKDLKQRSQTNWIVGYDSSDFYRVTLEFYIKFNQVQQPTIFLAESNPYLFLAAFLAAVASESSLFLCNPDWKKQEWEQVAKLAYPYFIIGLYPKIVTPYSSSKSHLPNTIMIPTGGTSGQIKFAIHSWETLEASVRGFQEYFGDRQINSCCILPLYHVSGLMQFIRSWLTEGKILLEFYSQIKYGRLPKIHPEKYFISLVPTQLQFLLNNYPEWLRRFYTVLLGGAPAWTTLLERARQERINLALTYGMTETASQIVTLKPQEFLEGNNSNGKVLPHARIRIDSQSDNKGTIIIKSKSLYKGYYPNLIEQTEFITDDLGYFDDKNNLFILGRNSQKIITGGENVFPKEIENAILSTKWVKDVVIIGVPDLKWGQVIVALYVPSKVLMHENSDLIEDLIKKDLLQLISKYKNPKYWIKINEIPRNLQGKINQVQLESIVNSYLSRPSKTKLNMEIRELLNG